MIQIADARKNGFSDDEIVGVLKEDYPGFDIDAARKSGFTLEDIAAELATMTPSYATVTPTAVTPDTIRPQAAAADRSTPGPGVSWGDVGTMMSNVPGATVGATKSALQRTGQEIAGNVHLAVENAPEIIGTAMPVMRPVVQPLISAPREARERLAGEISAKAGEWLNPLDLSEEDQKAMRDAGLPGDVAGAVATLIVDLPKYMVAGGAGGALAKSLLYRAGNKAVRYARPILFRKLGPQGLKWVDGLISQGVGFGALEGQSAAARAAQGGATTGEAIQAGLEQAPKGVAMGALASTGGMLGTIAKERGAAPLLAKTIGGVGTGLGMAAVPAAEGAPPDQIIANLLLGGFLHVLSPGAREAVIRSARNELQPSGVGMAADGSDIPAFLRRDPLKLNTILEQIPEAERAKTLEIFNSLRPEEQEAIIRGASENLQKKAPGATTVPPKDEPFDPLDMDQNYQPSRMMSKMDEAIWRGLKMKMERGDPLTAQEIALAKKFWAMEVNAPAAEPTPPEPQPRGIEPRQPVADQPLPASAPAYMRKGRTNEQQDAEAQPDAQSNAAEQVAQGEVAGQGKEVSQEGVQVGTAAPLVAPKEPPRLDWGPVKLSTEKEVDGITQLPNNTVTKDHLSKVPEDHVTADIDGDNFKAVNDQFGHQEGDRVLGLIGMLMRKHFPDLFIGRDGGEEFAIDFGKVPLDNKLVERVRAFQADVTNTIKVGPDGEPFTLSIGIGRGSTPKPDGSRRRISDALAYAAKENGRNQIAVADGAEKVYYEGRDVGVKEYVIRQDRSQANDIIDRLLKAGRIDAARAAAARAAIGIEGRTTPGGRSPVRPSAGTQPSKPAAPSAPAEEVANPAAVPSKGTAASPASSTPAEPLPSGYTANPPEAGSLTYGQTLPKMAGSTNLSRVINEGLDRASAGDEAYDLKKLFLDIYDQNRPAIEREGRGKMTLDEIERLSEQYAREAGVQPNQVLSRQRGQAYRRPEEMVYWRNVRDTAVQRLRKAHEEFYKKDPQTISDADRAKLALQLQETAAVIAQVAGATRETARTLSAHRIYSKAYADKQYTSMIDQLFGGQKITDRVLENFLKIDPSNESALLRYASNVTKPSLSDKAFYVWINSILSAPQTHIVNTTSNAVTMAGKPVQKLVAAAIDPIFGGPRQTFFREVPAQIKGALRGVIEGGLAAAKAWKTGESQFGIDSKLERDARHPLDINKPVGKVVSTPVRALQAEDDFFKAMVYRMSINEQAVAIAAKKGLKGEAYDAEVSRLRDNPTEDMIVKGAEEAKYRTYTKSLGQLGRLALMARRDFITKSGKRYPNPLKLIIPFVTTPANVAKFAVEWSPVGGIGKLVQYAQKEIPRSEIANEMSKSVVGSAVMAVAAGLASAGLLTGGGPKDQKERQRMYAAGWQPYSLKIPGKEKDTYISISRLEPMSSLLGIAADFADAMKENPDFDAPAVASKMVQSFAKNITSKTFMQGLANLMDLIYRPEMTAEKWSQSMEGSLVPNMVASAARAYDPTLRDVESQLDIFQARFPYLSQYMYPKRDLWGKPIKRAGDNFWMRFLSPVQITAATRDHLAEEILKVDASVGAPTDKLQLDDKTQAELKFKKPQLTLTPQEFDVYSKLSGRQAREDVYALTQTAEYKEMGKEDQAAMIESVYNKSHSLIREAVKTLAIDRRREPTDKELTEEQINNQIAANLLKRQGLSAVDAVRVLRALPTMDAALKAGLTTDKVEKLQKKVKGYTASVMKSIQHLREKVGRDEISQEEMDKRVAKLKIKLAEYRRELTTLPDTAKAEIGKIDLASADKSGDTDETVDEE